MKLPKMKKSKKIRERKLEDSVALYTEDIGMAGIKKSSYLSWSSAVMQPSIADLPLPNDEDERRKKRKVRHAKYRLVGDPILKLGF